MTPDEIEGQIAAAFRQRLSDSITVRCHLAPRTGDFYRVAVGLYYQDALLWMEERSLEVRATQEQVSALADRLLMEAFTDAVAAMQKRVA